MDNNTLCRCICTMTNEMCDLMITSQYEPPHHSAPSVSFMLSLIMQLFYLFSPVGPAGGSEASFFDHNPNAMNQWGYPPANQNSFPGGVPPSQQPQQSRPQQQQQQQQQAAPMFYNPADFQKSSQGQQPEVFNPYPSGQYYQPQEHIPQEGYQHQQDGYQQQPYGFGQQQYNQSDPVGHVPQDGQVQQHNQESGQEQVPYQQGYAAPVDNRYMFGYPGNQGDVQDAQWQNQEGGFGSHPQDGQPFQTHAQPSLPPATNVVSDGADVNSQGISAPVDSTEKPDQEDASSCSGFGAFFHDDGLDFMETNGKESGQSSENASERTRTEMNLPDTGNQSQSYEHIESNVIPEGKSDDTAGSVSSGLSSAFPDHSQSGTQSENHVPIVDPSLESIPQTTEHLHPRTDGSPFTYHDNVSPIPVPFNPTQEQVTGTVTSSMNNDAEESPVHILPDGHETSLPTRESSDLDPAPSQSIPSTAHATEEHDLTSPEIAVADSTSAVPELQSMPASAQGIVSVPQEEELIMGEAEPPMPTVDMNTAQQSVSESDLISRTVEPSPSSQNAPVDLELKLSQNIVTPVEDPVVSSPAIPLPSSQYQQSLVRTTQSDQPASSVPSEADESHPPPPPPPTKESHLPPPPQGQSPAESAQSGKMSDGEATSKDRSNSLSSGSHPSAFRQVRGHHGHRDLSVNPSPPLWQAQVPPLPSNILLAPAAMNISTNFTRMVPANPLGTASLSTAPMTSATVSTPRQAAASIASVVVPPMPAVVGPLISGNSNISQPAVSSTQPFTASTPSAVEQVTQNVSHLDINKTVPTTSASALPPVGSVQSTQVPQQPPQTPLSHPASVVQPSPSSQAHPIQPTSQQYQNVLHPQPGQTHPAVSTAPPQNVNPAGQSKLPPQGPNVAATLPQQAPSVQPPVSNQAAANVPATQQQIAATAPSQGAPATQPQQPSQQTQQQHPQQPQVMGLGSQGPQSQHPGYGQYSPEVNL